MSLKFPFAFSILLKELVSIDDVESGLDCNCICPSCKMRLKARKGDINIHHFAHNDKADEICDYSYWVSVRDMAKQILLKKKFLGIYQHKIEKFHRRIFNTNSDLIQIFYTKKNYNEDYDIFVSTSIGNIYIYFKTNEQSSIDRDRQHKKENKYFSLKLSLCIDFTQFSNIRDSLEFHIISKLVGKDFVKPQYRFMTLDSKKKVSINTKLLSNMNNDETSKSLPLYKLPYVKESYHLVLFGLDEKALSKNDIRIVNTMINFSNRVLSRDRKEALTEYYSIVESTSNGHWLISYNNEFYCLVNITNKFYIYQVFNRHELVYIGTTTLLKDVPFEINNYLFELHNAF